MKIKELHLRNIASIEQADIDFEKGLTDGVTGDPASVFLICGDTGAGKSVILDGISMALYKNTPRLEGVQNKKTNRFSTSEGESIQVHDIEQYTRLGISDKDECYSEVVFIGNDDIEYRARLTLGMLLGNTDKATGKRPLKHRAPKWEVKVGNAASTTDNVADTILSAVGLSFSQFGRMAMLAQGQFATFLTGDKTERESILEQLTNTEHFSSYGKAIKSLFDKAKKARNDIEIQYKTELQHSLPQDQVKALTEEKDGLEKQKDELVKSIAAIDLQLGFVKDVQNGRQAANDAVSAITSLEAIVNGQEYKEKKALVTDWDATATERQRLKDLQVARAKLTAAKNDQQWQKIDYSELASDLEARREKLANMDNPQEAVNKKQQEIEELTKQREDLNPSMINTDLQALSRKKADLSALSAREGQIQKDRIASGDLEEEIKKDKEKLGTKKDTFDNTQKAFLVAKDKSEQADKRYLTMSSSVDEYLMKLRISLVQEHAETCPLCGQPLHEIPVDEEFYKILSPLEEEKKVAAKALKKATYDRDAAKTDYDTFNGALVRKERDLTSRREAIGKAVNTLAADAARFGMDTDKPLAGQIESIMQEMARQEEALAKLQAEAEGLQSQITKAQTEKTMLDKALQKYKDERAIIEDIEETYRKPVVSLLALSDAPSEPKPYACADIKTEWNKLYVAVVRTTQDIGSLEKTCGECSDLLGAYYGKSGKTEADLAAITLKALEIDGARKFVQGTDANLQSRKDALVAANVSIGKALKELGIDDEKNVPDDLVLQVKKTDLQKQLNNDVLPRIGIITNQLVTNTENAKTVADLKEKLDKAAERQAKWDILYKYFGGSRFRTLVQTYILRPLLNNANIYLERITDRYTLTCSEDNEQLAILVLDKYNKMQVRSVTVLSGGERFMISLALSLALSSLNRPDMNVNILFIDEGFGTLDEKSLDSVMETLEKIQEIAGQGERRVGIISHREELNERIPVQIRVKKKGEGRSAVEIVNN